MSLGHAGSLAIALLFVGGSALAQRATERHCTVVMPVAAVPNLREGSGLALSRRLPRRLFSINDSAAPELIVLNLDGTPRGKVAVTGAWEGSVRVWYLD